MRWRVDGRGGVAGSVGGEGGGVDGPSPALARGGRAADSAGGAADS